MIKVNLNLDKNNLLQEIKASGHAGLSKKGTDILCAAVSIILRTTAKLIYANPGINCAGGKGSPGELELKINSYKPGEKEWMKGITDFCVIALFELRHAYPGKIQITRSGGDTPAA